MELSTPTAIIVLLNGAGLLILNAILLLPKIRPFLTNPLGASDTASQDAS